MPRKDPFNIPYENNPVIDFSLGFMKIFLTDKDTPKFVPITVINEENYSVDVIAKRLVGRKASFGVFLEDHLPPDKPFPIKDIILPNYSVRYDFEDRFTHIDPSKKILLLLHDQKSQFKGEERLREKEAIMDFINTANSTYDKNVINLSGLSIIEMAIIGERLRMKNGKNLDIDFATYAHHGYHIDGDLKGHTAYGRSQLNYNIHKHEDFDIEDEVLLTFLSKFSKKGLDFGLFLGCQNDPLNAKFFNTGCFMPAVFNQNISVKPKDVEDHLKMMHCNVTAEEASEKKSFYHKHRDIKKGFYKHKLIESKFTYAYDWQQLMTERKKNGHIIHEL